MKIDVSNVIQFEIIRKINTLTKERYWCCIKKKNRNRIECNWHSIKSMYII